MELREIPIVDIYPDEKNPRKDFGNINALAESCMLNAINPGEPVNPIVVVQDGGIYRIVDGERRYKAMRHNNIARCRAVVCDDMDEANVMIAMIATDDKQQLNDIERSRGVQQAMLLGVDPAKVESMGRMTKGSAAKLRRARAVVDDAGDDMTLERMLAIAEFAEDGDDDAVEALTDCKETEWKYLATEIRSQRVREAEVDAVVEACRAAGVDVEDKAPDGTSYIGLCRLPQHLEDHLAHRDPDSMVAVPVCKQYMYGVELYGPAQDSTENNEAKLQRAELDAKIEHGVEHRAKWFASCAKKNQYNPNAPIKATPNLIEYLIDSFFNADVYGSPSESCEKFAELTGYEDDDFGVVTKLDGPFASLLYIKGAEELAGAFAYYLDDDATIYETQANRMNDHLEFVRVCESDGYEPDDTVAEVEAMIAKALEKYEKSIEEEAEYDCEDN